MTAAAVQLDRTLAALADPHRRQVVELLVKGPRAAGDLARDGTGLCGRLIETRAGGKVFEIGRITAWDPPHRLAFAWRQANFPPGLSTEVEVVFEAVGEVTRVSVEHRGFDQVPAGAARHGWPDQVLLLRLADFWRAQIAAVAARLG